MLRRVQLYNGDVYLDGESIIVVTDEKGCGYNQYAEKVQVSENAQLLLSYVDVLKQFRTAIIEGGRL